MCKYPTNLIILIASIFMGLNEGKIVGTAKLVTCLKLLSIIAYFSLIFGSYYIL